MSIYLENLVQLSIKLIFVYVDTTCNENALKITITTPNKQPLLFYSYLEERAAYTTIVNCFHVLSFVFLQCYFRLTLHKMRVSTPQSTINPRTRTVRSTRLEQKGMRYNLFSNFLYFYFNLKKTNLIFQHE